MDKCYTFDSSKIKYHTNYKNVLKRANLVYEVNKNNKNKQFFFEFFKLQKIIFILHRESLSPKTLKLQSRQTRVNQGIMDVS